MSEQERIYERIARFTAFSTLGVLGTAQDLARITLEQIPGVDPEVVAEETLCLVATATARAAEVGLRQEPEVRIAVVPAVIDLPFAYRDYLVGGAMIVQKTTSLLDANEEIYQRLQRKREFYKVHLPENQFPGERMLTEKMVLWMGRLSPPNLPDSPEERLEKLEVLPTVLTHLKLVLAFGRQGTG